MAIRETVLNIMRAWIGCKQGDAIHHSIVDCYNTIRPLPRDHKLTYTESWCAGTTSAAYHKAGYDTMFPFECSCGQQIEIAKKMGIWVEKDNYIPQPADTIIYAWTDPKPKEDNTTGHNHTGMVESVEGGKITVIEGNKGASHICARRVIPINGKNIRGFITPKFQDVKKVVTTREITVWTAPEKIDANRERMIPEGYIVTVYAPDFEENGERWYKTIKGKYILSKYCK